MNTTALKYNTTYWLAKTTEELELKKLILKTLKTYGAEAGWRVVFSRESNRYGFCDHVQKAICISRKVVVEGGNLAFDTAMHEVAHALAGGSAGHGPRWKKWAKELGAKPEAVADTHLTSHHGVKKTVKTSFGTVEVELGKDVVTHPVLGKLQVSEVHRKYFTGISAAGTAYRVAVDILHPNYGDVSKIAPKIVMLQGVRGVQVPVVLGETVFTHQGIEYTIYKAARSTAMAISAAGNQLKIPASAIQYAQQVHAGSN